MKLSMVEHICKPKVVAEVVELLPSESKALSSNSSTTQNCMNVLH
jgi:hypothetical protein